MWRDADIPVGTEGVASPESARRNDRDEGEDEADSCEVFEGGEAPRRGVPEPYWHCEAGAERDECEFYVRHEVWVEPAGKRFGVVDFFELGEVVR